MGWDGSRRKLDLYRRCLACRLDICIGRWRFLEVDSMRLPGLEFRLIPGMFRLYTDFVNDALLHFFQFLCVSSVSLQIIFDVPLPIYLRYRHLRLMDP